MNVPLQYSARLTVRTADWYYPHTSVVEFIFADRCLQTARPISKELGLPVFVEHGKNL
jgi:hypothetical protein